MLKIITRNYSLMEAVCKKPLVNSIKWNIQDYLLNKEWFSLLENEFHKEYFIAINKKLNQEYAKNLIYPKKEEIFRALNMTTFSQVLSKLL